MTKPGSVEALREVQADKLAEEICDSCLEGGHDAIETWIDHAKVYDLVLATLASTDAEIERLTNLIELGEVNTEKTTALIRRERQLAEAVRVIEKTTNELDVLVWDCTVTKGSDVPRTPCVTNIRAAKAKSAAARAFLSTLKERSNAES